MMRSFRKKTAGISMVELLEVGALIGGLIAALLVTMAGQIGKGRDGRRKADLKQLTIAFEDYYNDHECYPTVELLENCHSEDLKPYMKVVPCDPKSRQPYGYLPEADCSGYQLYAFLENPKDPQGKGLNHCFGLAKGVELSACGE